jgi:hypothetical protein
MRDSGQHRRGARKRGSVSPSSPSPGGGEAAARGVDLIVAALPAAHRR